MVERVLITPDRLLLKNSSDQSIFDTNYKYVKTASSGTWKTGGYATAPGVYGGDRYNTASGPVNQYSTLLATNANSIGGAFPARLIPGGGTVITNPTDPAASPSFSVVLPGGLNYIGCWPWAVQRTSSTYQNFIDPAGYISYYVDGVIAGGFRWAIDIIDNGTYNTGMKAVVYPGNITVGGNVVASGTYEFPKSPNALTSFPFNSGGYSGTKPTGFRDVFSGNPELLNGMIFTASNAKSIGITTTA